MNELYYSKEELEYICSDERLPEATRKRQKSMELLENSETARAGAELVLGRPIGDKENDKSTWEVLDDKGLSSYAKHSLLDWQRVFEQDIARKAGE